MSAGAGGGFAGHPNEHALGDAPREMVLEWGTVGWEDEQEYVDIGTSSNDGYTLVRVQLFRGRDLTKSKQEGVAQGHKVLVHINTLFGKRIPKPGTRVMVGFPSGMSDVPGGGVILATVEPMGNDTQVAKDRIVIDFGSDTHVVFRAKSIALQDANAARWIGVGQPRAGGAPGVFAMDETGSGWTIQSGTLGMFSSQSGDAQSVLQINPTGIDLSQKQGGMSGLQLQAGHAKVYGQDFTAFAGIVYLGAAATAANKALWGASGPAGTASLTVYIQP